MRTKPHSPLIIFVCLFFLLSLACTPSLPAFPLGNDQATLPPAPTIDPNPPATATPAVSPTSSEPTITSTAVIPLPTFTPRVQATPTLASSGTNNNNNGGVATIVPLGTETAPAVGGPLSFTYQVVWQADPADATVMLANLTITASGGDGNYQYFRDEVSLPGPVVQYRWGKCAGNPGSLRVTSGDGQTLKIDYYENAPCN